MGKIKSITEGDLSKIVGKLAELDYVYGIYLFGSKLSKKARKDSDIDIAVFIKDPDSDKEFDVAGYGNDNFDITAFSRLPLIIQFRVLRDGKLLYCKDKRALNREKVKVFKNYWDFSVFIKRFYRKILDV